MRDGLALYEASVRVENMMWLPGTLSEPEAPAKPFNEFCEDLPENDDAPLYADLPELKQFCSDEDYPDEDRVAEALVLARRAGFLVQLATPVVTYRGKVGSFSWGHYKTIWRYFESLEALTSAAIEWSDACREQDKARSKVLP